MKELSSEAKRIKEEHKNINLHVVYAGDFNSRPESQVYNILKYHTYPIFDYFDNDIAIEQITSPEYAQTLMEIRLKEHHIYELI